MSARYHMQSFIYYLSTVFTFLKTTIFPNPPFSEILDIGLLSL